MKYKKRIKKSRSLADLKAWRRLISFYEDVANKSKLIEQLKMANINFTDASLATTLRCFELVQQTKNIEL